LAGPGVELSIEAIMSAAAERQIAVSADSTARMLAVVSNVRRLRRCYQPARIAGGMTLIRALLEPNNGDARFDWDAFVDGQVRLIRISATHDSIMLAPQVDRVAKILAECHAAARDYAENA
jgi:thioesterase domain-containing protein